MGYSLIRKLIGYRKSILFVTTPLVLSFIPILYNSKAGRCAYGLAIIGIFWMTETLPISATALLPLVLFPWLGVLESREIAPNYLSDSIFLFFGGLLFAVAVERWNLHKRIALKVLLMVGSKPQWLMFGFMITTAFLSMWLSNTATTAMLVPIAHAVTEEMQKESKQRNTRQRLCDHKPRDELVEAYHNDSADAEAENLQIITLANGDKDKSENCSNANHKIHDTGDSSYDLDHNDQDFNDIASAMKFSICWAANIGGTATLTGTGPNIIAVNTVEKLYGEEAGLNFTSWFIFAFPNMLICLFLCWIWLLIVFIGPRSLLCNKKNINQFRAGNIIRKEYRKLGPISFAEISVAIVFTLLVILWITKKPANISGWGDLPFINNSYISNGCVGVSMAILLYILPSEKPSLFSSDKEGAVPPLLDWDTTQKQFNWGVIILIGGGFAIADVVEKSGLSDSVGVLFKGTGNMQLWLLVAMFGVLTSAVTEFTTNSAATIIMLPIVTRLADVNQIHPFYFILTVAIASSFSFMLPVATAPNAIVYSYKGIKFTDMMKNGFVLNVICLLMLQLNIHTMGYYLFDLKEYPSWAVKTNSTLIINTTVPRI